MDIKFVPAKVFGISSNNRWKCASLPTVFYKSYTLFFPHHFYAFVIVHHCSLPITDKVAAHAMNLPRDD